MPDGTGVKPGILQEGGREYMSTGKPVGTVGVGIRRKAEGGGMRFPCPNWRLARHNDQGLSVKQVRIRADRLLEKERESIVEHPFGRIKRAMGGIVFAKGRWRESLRYYFSPTTRNG
jgi:hypothetical protein